MTIHKTGFNKGRLGIGLDISDNSGIPQQALEVNGDIRLTGTFIKVDENGQDKPVGFASFGAVLTEPLSIKTSELTDADLANEPDGDMHLEGTIDVSSGIMQCQILDISCSDGASLLSDVVINKDIVDSSDDTYSLDISGNIQFHGTNNKLVVKSDNSQGVYTNSYFHLKTPNLNTINVTDDGEKFNANILNIDTSENNSENNTVHVGGNVIIGNSYIENKIAPMNSVIVEGGCTVGKNVQGEYGLDISGTMRSDARLKASDIKFKEDVKPLKDCLVKIEKINGVYYNLKDTNNLERYIGVIAQEVEPIFPELVKSLKDDIKAVRYEDLIAVLVEAVKELTKKVVALEEEIPQL
tara:strand:- start:2391 stop:3452 length:1062 start_codon:yes stop_codon:yes gene_type:complete